MIKHSRDLNLARESTLSSGLAPETPAFDMQRACGTSLSAAILIGSKIATGLIDAGIAGGTDSISDVPIVYPEAYRNLLLESARGRTLGARVEPWLKLRPRHFKPVFPRCRRAAHAALDGREHGDHGEGVADLAREQDELALASHQNAAKAYAEGFYDDLLVEYHRRQARQQRARRTRAWSSSRSSSPCSTAAPPAR